MHYIKDFLANLNIKVTALLTPVAYMEYAIKMLFILNPKNILKLFQVDMLIHITLLISGLIVTPIVLPVNAVAISALVSAVILLSFLAFRIKVKKTTFNISEAKIQLKPLELTEIKIPDDLKNYITEDKENDTKN